MNITFLLLCVGFMSVPLFLGGAAWLCEKWQRQKETPVAPKLHVVEIPTSTLPPDSEETVSQVASLEGHPGFRWLLAKLNYQAARLRSELQNSKHQSLSDVQFLQSGIHWCDWLRGQLDFAKQRYQSIREATTLEQKFFEELSSSLDLIGSQPQNPQQ